MYGILARTDERFVFAADEEERARAWLRRRGWRESEPFVCLLARDSAYLDTDPMYSKQFDWKYHSYRDCDINSFAPAVQALLARGYWVVRLGKIMHHEFPLRHPRLIDYPFADDQDDLLDIWLSARCALFISTGTGIDMIPFVYRRPLVFVNFSPLASIFSYADNICVPKNLYWRNTGKPLTLREYFDRAYLFRTIDYETDGIELRDLTAAEIQAVVLEGEERIRGKWVESTDNETRQRRFWKILKEWPRYKEQHSWIHPQARIGAAWLASKGNAFFE